MSAIPVESFKGPDVREGAILTLFIEGRVAVVVAKEAELAATDGGSAGRPPDKEKKLALEVERLALPTDNTSLGFEN